MALLKCKHFCKPNALGLDDKGMIGHRVFPIVVGTKVRFPPAVEFPDNKKCLNQGIFQGQIDGGGGATLFEL
ncbi:MAG: hypothetical protein WC911_09180 [Thermoleophilia bacterium]